MMDSIKRPDAATPWTDLLSAVLSTADAGERIAQLATTRGPESDHLSGRPACRSINIRSLRNGKLYFITDLRSQKVDDVTHSPFVELCWYIPRIHLQFRISGQYHLYDSCSQSAAFWQTLENRERLWFAWPHPGKQWSGDQAFNVQASEQPPENFGVFEIVPTDVEVLDISVLPFHRERHTLSKDESAEKHKWTVMKFNP